MKKYPWVPITCFIATLLISYVAGVSGKASPLAPCHSKANVKADKVDGLVIQLSPSLEISGKWSQVNQAFAGEFYTFHGVKLKQPSDVFLAVGAKTFGPQTVTKEPPKFVNTATLGWQGGGNHAVKCCHNADAVVNCGITLRWRFEPIHDKVPAAGKAEMGGIIETNFTPEGAGDCLPNPGFIRKKTEVNFTVTYSKPDGMPPKTSASGSTATNQTLGGGVPLPQDDKDISDNTVGPAGTKPLEHTFVSQSQFESNVTLRNEVRPGTIRATAESAVSVLSEIKWEINEIHLNDNLDGKNNKTDLTN